MGSDERKEAVSETTQLLLPRGLPLGPHVELIEQSTRHEVDRLTPLGWALAWLLIAVSVVDVVIGRWLWQGKRRGAVLALVMAPVSFALGWLFALPYLLVMAPLRAIGVVVAWRELRP